MGEWERGNDNNSRELQGKLYILTSASHGLESGYSQDGTGPRETGYPHHRNHLVGVELGLPSPGLQGSADCEVSLQRYGDQSPDSDRYRHR